MKVSELSVGMLLHTPGQWEISVAPWPAYRKNSKSGFLSGELESITGVTVVHTWNREPKKEILMFVGTSRDNFYWGSTLTHHRFLWNGKAVIMTGYDIKYLEQYQQSD